MSVTMTSERSGRKESSKEVISAPEVSVHPLTATLVPLTSAPRTILSGPYSRNKDLNKSGSLTAIVPKTTLEAPASRIASTSPRVLIPPPHSISVPWTEDSSFKVSRLTGKPDFAPSRSTACTRVSPEAKKRSAISRGLAE